MSHTPNFPEEDEIFNPGHSEKKEEEKPQVKRPEFILIDDRYEKSQYSYFGSDSFRKGGSFQKENEQEEKRGQSLKGPIALRLLCLFGLIFCIIFGLGILILSIILSLLAIISLFRNHHLNRNVLNFLKLYIHTMVAGLGFALGIISPTLGLGLIALYFAVAGEVVGDHFLRKFVHRSFNNFKP